MQGKIMKGIAGFYYVYVVGSGLYECKAKGIFRKENVKPLVGDNVEIEVLDEQEKEGNLVRILPRENELVRPASANIDQALVVFALKDPKPNIHLLNRFLVMMENKGIPSIICLNKKDKGSEEEIQTFQKDYENCGYPLLFTTIKAPDSVENVKTLLHGKTTVVAGPSGVGKSSLINMMQSEISMEIGDISQKNARGKNTTRHAELIPIDEESFIMDTPGFSSLYMEEMDPEDLKYDFLEFSPFEGSCRFNSCQHIHEPGCAVKQAVEEGKIAQSRYDDYVEIYEELQENRAY